MQKTPQHTLKLSRYTTVGPEGFERKEPTGDVLLGIPAVFASNPEFITVWSDKENIMIATQKSALIPV